MPTPVELNLGKNENTTLDVLFKSMRQAFEISGLKKWGFRVSGNLVLKAGLIELGIEAEFWAEGELE